MELYVGVDGCPQGWFFVAISKVSEHGLSTVPADPGFDQQGLPMEIVYYSV